MNSNNDMNLNNENINLNFYNLLNCDQNEDLDEKICLISKESLTDNSITLSCGHEFNYIPLYHEVKYQKQLNYYNNYNNLHYKLNLDEMKCPYCRTITKQIMPYFKCYNLNLVRGVNMPQKYSLKIHSCQHISKTKKTQCGKSACKTDHGILCNQHYQQSINKNKENKENKEIKEIKEIKEKNSKQKLEDSIIKHSIPIEYYNKFNKLRVNQLKDLLRQNNYKVGGRKIELIERIYNLSISNNILINI